MGSISRPVVPIPIESILEVHFGAKVGIGLELFHELPTIALFVSPDKFLKAGHLFALSCKCFSSGDHLLGFMFLFSLSHFVGFMSLRFFESFSLFNFALTIPIYRHIRS